MRKQIKQLMLGNGLAQLLQFGSILILSRIYQPSDFGLLAQVQSIAMVASIVLTLQLHLTIPLSKTLSDAVEAVKYVQALGLFIFLVSLMPAIWIGGGVLYALILSLFLGLTNTYTGYLVYSGNFERMSVFYVARAFLIILMQIVFAYARLEHGLIVASLIGEAMSALYLGMGRMNFAHGMLIKFSGLKSFVSKNRAFSFYGTIQEMISVLAFYAPLLLFTTKYGDKIGGQYAMANRLVWAPVVLVSSSFAQVLYHKLGKIRPTTTADIRSLIPDKRLCVLAVVVVLGTFLMTGLFHNVLGQEWDLASEFLPLQLLWGLFFLASTPFRVAARVLLLQKYQLFIDLLMITLACLLFYLLPFEPMGMMISLLMVVFLQHSSIVALAFFKVKA